MGADMQAYSVDVEALRQMVGSGDRELLEQLLTQLEGGLDRLEAGAAGWGESVPARQALTKMILEPDYLDGVPNPSDDAAIYIYVFKEMCEHYGKSLDNEYEMSSEWLGEVEEALNSVGVYCEPSEYFVAGDDLPLPGAFPYPIAGCIDLEVMAELRDELEPALSADVDSDVLETVTELSEWAHECLRERRGLVWFFY
ncbi:DUF7691 family protein [Nocardia aurantiaca]|uniref:DUF7691 domain-containing protein n=1 Tax=Nocardia aurantiaca TaxID=2675850 RepID=A0A6I3KXP4_9NOCA|nr:hypothetical protein [Nocardia aurantiaca]MTE12864.1 hypothetical protein [Nocardia aurantiaca]